jgi:hypothetical protein
MNKSKSNKSLFSGRSMVEMLGVIAIGALLTGATMQLYSYATRKTKSLQMENQIADTVEDIRILLLGRSWEKLTRIADESEAKTYLEGKKIKMMDVWGSPIVIKRSADADKGRGRFVIMLSAINTGDCINLGKRVVSSFTRVNGSDEEFNISFCDTNANDMEFFFK